MSPGNSSNNGSLPFTEDGEKGLLCSLILSPREVAKLCADKLHPDALYIPAHRIIYEILLTWPKDERIDFVWLKAELKKSGSLEEIGGDGSLESLYRFVPTASNAEFYLDLVREQYARRRLILACNSVAKRCYDKGEKFEPLLSEAEHQVSEVIHQCNRKTTTRGASLLDLARRDINHTHTLLGKRWLCVGGGAMIVGPSGIGKSTLSVQAAALWAAGLPAFGIEPSRPIRVLVVQAEDDEGDLIEMARMIDQLNLDPDRLKLIEQNTSIEFLNDKTGPEFTRELARIIDRSKSELVIINPLSAYLGADTKDEESVNRFLRSLINPILTTCGAAAIFIHHTPKTTNRDTSEWKANDWMYAGSGVAGITNWARGYLVIEPTGTPGVFKFIAAKRGQRIGWDGFETYWAHSRDDGKLLWVPADTDQVASAKESSKSGPEDLLRFIPLLDPISQEKLHQTASEKGFGEKKIRRFLKLLEEEEKIFRHKIQRPNGVKAAIGYAKTPPSE
jgi:hypothetical protein